MADGLFPQMEACLWPKGPRRDVWMLADSARDRRVYGLLLECFYSTHVCLYADRLAPALKVVAPYLVPLEQDSRKSHKFLNAAWGKSWGVLVKCDRGADTLKRHLRGFLTVQDPQGQRLLFRFYDPRVLRTYLPTCTSEELASFFGPIECFWVEGEAAESMLEFRLSSGSLVQRTLSLLPGASSSVFHPELERVHAQGAEGRPPRALLRMRPAQMEAFSQAEVRKFERWMFAHLDRFFPAQCKRLGSIEVQDLVRYGIERAANHGIRSERDVCKFIDLMIVFGRDFDVRLPWASQILSNCKTAPTKVKALYGAAQSHMGRL